MRIGGGIIKRKLFLALLLLFGMVLILGANTASAQTVASNSLSPKVTASDASHSAVVLNGNKVKINFNKDIKMGSGWIDLKNSNGKIVKSSKSVSGKMLTVNPVKALNRGSRYTVTIHGSSIKDMDGHAIRLCNIKFTVSILTVSQMKDGISRAENFYSINKRLPNYVTYGAKKIPMYQFQKIIATQGLKLNTSGPVNSAKSASRSVKGSSAYNITITSLKVSATAKCSCGACGDYVYHTGSYKNYCPHCKKNDVLVWNPKGVAEGEWTCSYCGADYCAACGKEKSYTNPLYLVKI